MDNKKSNPSICCTVQQCTYHCGKDDHCTLNTIRVGTHEKEPCTCACVDCESFKAK